MKDRELAIILTLSLPVLYEPLIIAVQGQRERITFDMMAARLWQESETDDKL